MGWVASLASIWLPPADAFVQPRWGTDEATAMDTPPTQRWACARVARDHLGVSERTLARWRGSGLLKAGKHWRRKFPTTNSPVLYQLQLCEEAMGEATARTASHLEQPVRRTQSHIRRSWPQRRV